MAELFRDEIVPQDELYRMLRDEPDRAQYRRFVERLWSVFQPFADSDFALAIAQDFHARFWEMYLAFGLSTHGHHLLPPKKPGPDLVIRGWSEHPVWIEAVTTKQGSGDDRVPDMELGKVQRVPDALIVLRFRNSVKCSE